MSLTSLENTKYCERDFCFINVTVLRVVVRQSDLNHCAPNRENFIVVTYGIRSPTSYVTIISLLLHIASEVQRLPM
jgi:hypothetical protein